MAQHLPTEHKRFDCLCGSRSIGPCKLKEPDPGTLLETTEQLEALPGGGQCVLCRYREVRSKTGSAAVRILSGRNYADGRDLGRQNHRSSLVHCLSQALVRFGTRLFPAGCSPIQKTVVTISVFHGNGRAPREADDFLTRGASFSLTTAI